MSDKNHNYKKGFENGKEKAARLANGQAWDAQKKILEEKAKGQKRWWWTLVRTTAMEIARKIRALLPNGGKKS